jgi:hypothetical protein
VVRAAPEVGPIPFAALLAAALPLFSCAPPAAEPDASVPEGPTITSVEPADGATDVATNPVVRIGVSDHLDDWTVSSSAFKLHSGPLSYWLMAYYDPVGRRAVVWPSATIREGAYWVVEAREGITGRDGGPLAAGKVTGFTTGAEKGDDTPFEALEYEADIRPIFTARCSSCHGGNGPLAGLALDTADGVVETALGVPSAGDVAMDRVVPGRPGRSFLIYKIIDDDTGSIDRMPRSFGGDESAAPLSQAEQQAISDWIAAGAAIGP